MTDRHRGSKRKLRVGYRAPPLQRTSYFSSSSVVSYTFSALCVYSTFGHHPYPLGYLCAKFRFFRIPHCWASLRRNITYSLTHSLTHTHRAYLMPGNRSFRFGKTCNKICNSVLSTGMVIAPHKHLLHCTLPL